MCWEVAGMLRCGGKMLRCGGKSQVVPVEGSAAEVISHTAALDTSLRWSIFMVSTKRFIPCLLAKEFVLLGRCKGMQLLASGQDGSGFGVLLRVGVEILGAQMVRRGAQSRRRGAPQLGFFLSSVTEVLRSFAFIHG